MGYSFKRFFWLLHWIQRRLCGMENAEVVTATATIRNCEHKGKTAEIFNGSFGGEEVIIWKAPINNPTYQKVLRLLDHENIIKARFMECHCGAHLIVMNRCHCTLKEYVENSDHMDVTLAQTEVLKQVTRGLDYLHDGGIVHRNLHPANILLHNKDLCGKWKVKISGLSHCAYETKDTNVPCDIGEPGYVASDAVRAGEPIGKTKADDILSLGEIFHYTLSNGKQLFRKDDEDAAMRHKNPEFDGLGDYEDSAKNLIEGMVSEDTKKRPSVKVVKKHHLFWSASKKLAFIERVSNYLTDGEKHTSLRNEINNKMKDNWQNKIDLDCLPAFAAVMKERVSSTKTSLYDLVTYIRNWSQHYYDENTSEELRKEFGEYPYGFVDFFTSRFPKLLSNVYEAMEEVKHEPPFAEYYGVSRDGEKKMSPKKSVTASSETTKKKTSKKKKERLIIFGKQKGVRLHKFEVVRRRDLDGEIMKEQKKFAKLNLEGVGKNDKGFGYRDSLSAIAVKSKIYVIAWIGYIYIADMERDKPCWKKLKEETALHGRYPPADVLCTSENKKTDFDDCIFICGGGWEEGGHCELRKEDLMKVSAKCEAFDTDTHKLEPLPDLKQSRRHNTVVAAEGKIYCIGGQDESGKVLGSVEVFDPVKKEWTTLPSSLIHPRHKAAAVAFEKNLYVMGGKLQDGVNCNLTTQKVEFYDLQVPDSAGTWAEFKSMVVPRSVFSAFVCDSKLYVVGGDAGGIKFPAETTLEVCHKEQWKQYPLIGHFESACVTMYL